jgi:hypothetical protein
MRHLSVLRSAQGASNFKSHDQLLLTSTCAAVLKTVTPAKTRVIRGIAAAAILLLTIPPITDAAEARPGGGGGRGGGFGGHVGGGGSGFAGRGGGFGGYVGGGGAGFAGRGGGPSAPRVLAVAELDRSELAISPGGPLRRHGQASRRRAFLPITLQAPA